MIELKLSIFISIILLATPQQITLFDASILRNITLESDEEKINFENVEMIELSGLKEYVENSTNKLETIVGEKGVQISGGQIKTHIARALYNNPEVLIFDEATSALDKKTEGEFLNQIKRLKTKKTMIFISHDISCLKDCDKVYELNEGKLKHLKLKNKYIVLDRDGTLININLI